MSENNTIKINISAKDSDILDMFCELPEFTKQRLLELYIFEDVIKAFEKQIRGETDHYGWSTTGWRHGSGIRDHIAKITGIEKELMYDKESRIRALEFEVANYKKYYDWYWKVYRNPQTYEFVKKLIGFL